MPWTISTNAGDIRHTAANNWRCTDQDCPCQDSHEPATITPTSFWPLRPGSSICAWCLDAAGLEATQGESHGICAMHAEQLVAEAKARKLRRVTRA